MDSWIVVMMLIGSLVLGSIALFAFLWAVKSGQFDDEEKFLNAVKFDNVEDLNDAVNRERKKEELKKNTTAIYNFKSPTAFFLYNYASYSVRSTKALLFY